MSEPMSYALTTPQNEMPPDTFLLPICTTRERLHRMLSSLKTYELLSDDRDTDNIIDMLEALAYLDDPTTAPCYPQAGGCDEDTLLDSILGFVDEIISNIQTGGVSKAIGYVIDTLGSVIVETALKTIAVTAIGLATAGILNILIGGVSVGTVAIGAGEIVETILTLPTTTPTNIIEFVFEVAA